MREWESQHEVFFANVVVDDALTGRVALLVPAFLNSVFRNLGDLHRNVRACLWGGIPR